MSSFQTLLLNGANGITGYKCNYVSNATHILSNGAWEESQQKLPSIPDGVPQDAQDSIQAAVNAAKEYVSHLNKILISLTTYQTILMEYRKGNLLSDDMNYKLASSKDEAQKIIRQYETHYPIIMKYDEEIERLNNQIDAKKDKIRELERLVGKPSDGLS